MARPRLNPAKTKYNWKDQHPIVDTIRTVMQDDPRTYAKLAQDAGISPTTLRNWENGDVMRPTWPAIHAVLEACGYQIRALRNDRYIVINHQKVRGTASFRVVRVRDG